MKTKLLLFSLVLLTLDAYADKNWISIEPLNKTNTPMQNPQLDANLSQKESINKMINNVSIIKQLFDGTKKEEVNADSNKNWYALKTMEKK